MPTMQLAPEAATMAPAPIAEPNPWERMQDATLGAAASLHSAAIARHARIAEQWDELSGWRRGVYRLGFVATSAVGLALAGQSMRVTGVAAHGMEEMGLFDSPFNGSAAHASAVLHSDHTPPKDVPLTSFKLDHAALNERAAPEARDYDFALPADRNGAPPPLALDTWDAETGHGSVWNQSTAYAGELGYEDLNEAQKHELTGRILQYNGLSWDDARNLSPDDQPKMPPQNVVEGWLDEMGADRTHAAERPTTDTPPGPTGDLDGQPGGGSAEGADAQGGNEDAHPHHDNSDDDCNRPGFATWIPWLDCEANQKDVWMGVFVALIAATGIGAISQRRRSRRGYVVDPDDDNDPDDLPAVGSGGANRDARQGP